MPNTSPFLQELEESIAKGSDRARLRALWHATDVLIAGKYSDEQIWTFGEVIELLARDLEEASRAKLARLLANSKNAPINCINKLAHDDSIDVAEPILRQSERLDNRTLVSIAASASQAHLLAISKRKSVEEPVTDVLVSVGNREVIYSLASNPGARFSHFGFLQMIKRSENDSILIESFWTRKDIPRSIFQQLIAKASDEAKAKLERECPATATEIQTVVAGVTGELHSIFGPGSKDYFCAKKTVAALHRYGDLSEKKSFGVEGPHPVPDG
jgi:uncharacterized protein (DUF2336 family)